jgi:DNA-directed RNA polymerase specialized sigma24 family protein
MGGMDSRPGSRVVPGDADRFESLAPALGVRVRRALVAAYGVEVGSEAAADAMAYAWEHWEKVQTMDNPAGHLYRVGQSAARKYRPRRPIALPMLPAGDEWADMRPELPGALARLSGRQRAAVLLVHAHGETYADAAATLGMSVSTLRNHLNRGMRRLRTLLGEVDDAGS